MFAKLRCLFQQNSASIALLQSQVAALQAQSLNVTKETIRTMHEYVITDTGIVTKISDGAPDLSISWTAGSGANSNGNDYQVVTATALPNPNAWLMVEGDVNTGSGSGASANALITQNVKVTGTQTVFTLYTGDDGGGVDDARRRGVRLFLSYDKDVLTDATLS